jgi:hypothetical protein
MQCSGSGSYLACLVAAMVVVPPVVAACRGLVDPSRRRPRRRRLLHPGPLPSPAPATCPGAAAARRSSGFPLRFAEGPAAGAADPRPPGPSPSRSAPINSGRSASPPGSASPPARRPPAGTPPDSRPMLPRSPPAPRLELAFCSLEATDERLLRWLLRHPETRARRSTPCSFDTNADALEIVLAGRLILLRAATRRAGIRPGGAGGVAWPCRNSLRRLRLLSDDLHDSGLRARRRGRTHDPFRSMCRGCGALASAPIPGTARSCGHAMHRGLPRDDRRLCATPACDRRAGRPARGARVTAARRCGRARAGAGLRVRLCAAGRYCSASTTPRSSRSTPRSRSPPSCPRSPWRRRTAKSRTRSPSIGPGGRRRRAREARQARSTAKTLREHGDKLVAVVPRRPRVRHPEAPNRAPGPGRPGDGLHRARRCTMQARRDGARELGRTEDDRARTRSSRSRPMVDDQHRPARRLRST